jgi:hypothetical protein
VSAAAKLMKIRQPTHHSLSTLWLLAVCADSQPPFPNRQKVLEMSSQQEKSCRESEWHCVKSLPLKNDVGFGPDLACFCGFIAGELLDGGE